MAGWLRTKSCKGSRQTPQAWRRAQGLQVLATEGPPIRNDTSEPKTPDPVPTATSPMRQYPSCYSCRRRKAERSGNLRIHSAQATVSVVGVSHSTAQKFVRYLDKSLRPPRRPILIPLYTRIEDIETVLGFLSRQVGWISIDKAKKSLDVKVLDDRKVAAMTYLGVIDRDGSNIMITETGRQFNSGDRVDSLRQSLLKSDLYLSTLEWLHFGTKAEVTAVEVGQYWQAQHSDSLGGVRGDTLKDGAVFFFRVADAAELGKLTIGRGGKETRFATAPSAISDYLDKQHSSYNDASLNSNEIGLVVANDDESNNSDFAVSEKSATESTPTVTVSASPSIHVNVEIHIAADATAETVKEIFKNMARYVLDKHVED